MSDGRLVFCEECSSGAHINCRIQGGKWDGAMCICEVLEHPREPFPFTGVEKEDPMENEE